MTIMLKFLLFSCLMNHINSFSLSKTTTKNVVVSFNKNPELEIKYHHQSSSGSSRRSRGVILFMSGDNESTEEQQQVTEESYLQEEIEEEEKAKEDPEITLLKEEISSVEKKLANLKKSYSYLNDEVETYSEKGYLLKCAEIDNARRSRDASSSSNKLASQASSIQNFLPSYELLESLKDKYVDSEYAQGYAALSLKNAFMQLGVVEFDAKVGEGMDRSQCMVVSEEYSDEYSKGVVIDVVKSGMELNGYVIRLAECVVSLGSEEDAMREAEAAAEAEKLAEEEAKEEEEKEVDNGVE